MTELYSRIKKQLTITFLTSQYHILHMLCISGLSEFNFNVLWMELQKVEEKLHSLGYR